MTMSLFYIPCPNDQVAESISLKLLENKLIACANTIPGVKSFYWWENKIETTTEVVLLLKTDTKFKSSIEEFLKKNHPYSVFCLLEIDPKSINQEYLNWLNSSLK